MDLTQVATFLAAISALAGVVWTIVGGRKKMSGDSRASAFEQAMELLEAKTAEIDRLNKRVSDLERRERWHERRERKLIDALARYARTAPEVIESDLDEPEPEPSDDDDPSPPSAQAPKPPKRQSRLRSIFDTQP